MQVYETVMTTTVRVSEETNRKLDRLLARILLRSDRKLSKQELLALILEAGLDEDALLARVAGIRFPVPDDAWERIVRNTTMDWGVKTREEDIDEALYGESS